MTTVLSAVALPAALLTGTILGYRAGWRDRAARELEISHALIDAVLDGMHDEARARASITPQGALGRICSTDAQIFDFEQHRGPFGGAA